MRQSERHLEEEDRRLLALSGYHVKPEVSPQLELTERTRRVFEAIIAHKRLHDGNSPSLREIMRATGITSISVTWYHLQRLVNAGLVRTPPSLNIRSRSIEVVGGQWTYQTSERAGA